MAQADNVTPIRDYAKFPPCYNDDRVAVALDALDGVIGLLECSSFNQMNEVKAHQLGALLHLVAREMRNQQDI